MIDARPKNCRQSHAEAFVHDSLDTGAPPAPMPSVPRAALDWAATPTRLPAPHGPVASAGDSSALL